MDSKPIAQQETDEPDTGCPPVNSELPLPQRVLNWLINREVLGLWLLGLSVVLVISIIAIHLLSPGWNFSVNARSRIVELVTPQDAEIRWRIDGSVICVDRKFVLPDTLFSHVGDSSTICGGRRWTGYHALAPEQVIILHGRIDATLELRDDRSLFMSLRSQQQAGTPETAGQASLSFTRGHDDIPLSTNGKLRVNLIFPTTLDDSLAERVFPFRATTTIGRDINWAGSRLLTGGTIDVYSIDDSPDQRRKVDSTDLMMGDQLRLLPSTRKQPSIYPKGFVRQAADSDALDVIAFGAARRLQIDRYGENGYEFEPGIIESLLNNSRVQLAISIYIGIVTVVTAIAGVCGHRDPNSK
jgi:hypothetical protein